LLLIVLRAGWVNWQIARPAILQITKDPAELFTKKGESIFAQFSRTLELEVTAGLLVITVAGILGGIAPPGEEGLYRLNAQEMSALATPDLPTTRIVDPAKFVGANERTLDDLRYAEFTHNWSGIIVLLLGICWLAQSSSRQRIFSRLWPLLLVPFGFFIAVAADPEIWILRNVSVLQVLRDPQLIEHQIGAALVFLLVWFGWRDAKRSKETQPLGYTLPILMVCGSLMLLGHAHTNLAGTEQLGTMINVEHAIFGTLGLFAGITRWFQLRSLIPENMARICWPMCVITLGVYMAFFYREAL